MFICWLNVPNPYFCHHWIVNIQFLCKFKCKVILIARWYYHLQNELWFTILSLFDNIFSSWHIKHYALILLSMKREKAWFKIWKLVLSCLWENLIFFVVIFEHIWWHLTHTSSLSITWDLALTWMWPYLVTRFNYIWSSPATVTTTLRLISLHKAMACQSVSTPGIIKFWWS